MKIIQKIFKKNYKLDQKELSDEVKFINEPHIAIAFINSDKIFWENTLKDITKSFNQCKIIGCTTAGHIADGLIYDDEMVITFIKLQKSKFHLQLFENISPQNSFDTGKEIATYAFEHKYSTGLVFSDGLNINGSKLVDGLNWYSSVINFFGGLAGDSTKFEKTNVIYNGEFINNAIVVAFVEGSLCIKTEVGSGWQAFGVERVVTKSINNIVYEIDSEPALKVYDEYLGEKSKLLPAYGLHFPINLNKNSHDITRTLLAINREEGSLTYAGDVKESSTIKLMKSESKELIQAAQSAIEKVLENEEKILLSDQLIFSVSCVGRRLVLGQATEDECELNTQKNKTIFSTGFYSYGEIAKNKLYNSCELHNQTFTVTKIFEE